MITDESVREAIATARIEDVVGDFVNLRRRGNNYSGLCPFHNEKTPSFNVNPARNIYKCFGCGVGGDPVKFLMELEQLSFPEAIRWIARKYNLALEEKELSPEFQAELQERDALLIVNDFARTWFEDQLHHGERGKSVGLGYFRKRGFRRETLETFGLGYAPPERDALRQAALAAGHKEEQLEKVGLVRNGRDFFRDRVMFTIHNLSGKPIAFAGRLLKKEAKAPKYINSPETEVYHKSRVLYGMYQARRAVRKLDNIFMVEGYTDVISLHQNGIQNVVATSGTSLTDGQAALVKRFTNNTTLLYDGDKAGIKAALRGVDVLLKAELNVRVVVLPEGHDPDSYLQEVGITAFERYLEEERKDFLLFKTDLLIEAAGDDVAARTGAIREAVGTLALVQDPLTRATYLQRLSERLKVDESVLVDYVNRAVSERRKDDRKREQRLPSESARPAADPAASRPATGTAPPRESIESGHVFQERYLLALLIRDGHKLYDEETRQSTAAFLIANVADLLDDFDSAAYRDMVRLVMAETSAGRPPEPQWYTAHPNAELRELAQEVMSAPYVDSQSDSPKWEEDYGVYLRQLPPEENHCLQAKLFLYVFRLKKIRRKVRENVKEITRLEAMGEGAKVVTYLRLQTKLKEMEMDLARVLGAVDLGRA